MHFYQILILFLLGANFLFPAQAAIADAQLNRIQYDIPKLTPPYAFNRIKHSIGTWLNQYGTAKIHVGLTKEIKISNADIGLLFPLSDKNHFLWFTQNGFYMNAKNKQLYTGFGTRLFSKNSLIGGNLVFDYDFYTQHYRLSTGLEFWKNYVKISSNYYLALSDWKLELDKNLFSKPANGVDVNIDFHLPFWTALGLRANFEKYFGDISHTETIYKNPQYLNIGLTYAFTPSINFFFDYRYDHKKESNIALKMAAIYRFGVPLEEQLNIDNIAYSKSLQGSRYDFITRHDPIILQYDKAVILDMKSQISGFPGEQKLLFNNIEIDNVKIKNWYGDSEILENLAPTCFDNSSLLKCSIRIPNYKKGNRNNYKLSVILENNITKVSYSAETQITVRNNSTRNEQILTLYADKNKLFLDSEDPAANYTDIYVKLKKDAQASSFSTNDVKLAVYNNDKLIELKTFKKIASGLYKSNLAAYKAAGYAEGVYKLILKIKDKFVENAQMNISIEDSFLEPKKEFTDFTVPDIIYQSHMAPLVFKTKNFYGKPIKISDFDWQVILSDKTGKVRDEVANLVFESDQSEYKGVYKIEAIKTGEYQATLYYRRKDNPWKPLLSKAIEIRRDEEKHLFYDISSAKNELIINYDRANRDSTDLLLKVTNDKQELVDLPATLAQGLKFVVSLDDNEIDIIDAIPIGIGSYKGFFFAHQSKNINPGRYNVRIKNKKGYISTLRHYINILDGYKLPSATYSIFRPDRYLLTKRQHTNIHLTLRNHYGEDLDPHEYDIRLRVMDKNGNNFDDHAYVNGNIYTGRITFHAKISGFVNVAIDYKRKHDHEWIQLKIAEFQITT